MQSLREREKDRQADTHKFMHTHSAKAISVHDCVLLSVSVHPGLFLWGILTEPSLPLMTNES